MVLGADHRVDGLAVGEGQEGCLLAFHEFFDDDAAAGFAEGGIVHDLVDGIEGFFEGHGDDDAFASGEAVGFDDDWGALFLDVGAGFVGVGEDFVLGGRDAVLLHEILGEGLGAFDLGGELARAEGFDAGGVHGVDDAVRQRDFGADDDEVDGFVLGELDEGFVIADVDASDALGDVGHAGIAGDGVELGGFWRLGEFPGQGVLAAAGTDD